MKKGIELIARFLGYDYLVLVMTTGALKYLGALLTIMITNVIGLVITPIVRVDMGYSLDIYCFDVT